MDQLSALRVFVAVVDAGSFARVSEKMAIPRSTVTTLIQGLEAHLTTKLLNRTTRHVAVTTDGALYYERAMRIISDIDELDASFTKLRDNAAGRIRVEMASAFSDAIVIPALNTFHARYPDIRVDIGIGDRNADYMAEGIDCALRAGAPTDQSIIARQVAEMHFATCASPEYLKRFGIPRHPDDLRQNHKFVGYFKSHTGKGFPFNLRRSEEHFEFNPSLSFSVSDSRSYMVAAERGLGIAQLPEFAARQAIASGRLVALLPDWEREPMALYVVYPPNRHLSNKVRVFVDWLIQLFAEFKRSRTQYRGHDDRAA